MITQAALAAQNDYSVRELAERICHGLPSKAYLDEYLAIYYFLLSHTRYMRDPRTVELVRDPVLISKMILRGERPAVDCDDSGAEAMALTLSCGGSSRVVTVAFRHMFHNGQRQFSHVFGQAQEPESRQWVTIDPVAASNTRSMLRRVVAAKVWPIA